MTLRLPPTSACAAAARRPSPVPRARVRRCPACVARSRHRADRQGSAGQEAWRGMAVRRSPSRLALPWLLTLRWIDVHRIVANYWSSAGRAGRRRSCCSTAQGGSSWPALPAAAVHADREPSFCCGPPAAAATARILGTHCRSGGLPPLSSGSRAAQPQQGQPQQGQPQQGHGSQQPCSRGLT